MRRLFVGCLALIGGITVLLVALGIGGTWYVANNWHRTAEALPGNAILSVDLEKGLRESEPSDPISSLLATDRPTLPDLLEALRRGGADARVKGLFFHIGGGSVGFAQTQELRDAIAAFRAKGKFALVFSESFGEAGPGTAAYYLASAFDQIWLQPVGLVGLTGLRAETPFFKGALDRLGIQPQIAKRSEYKSAPDSALADGQSAADKEQLTVLLGSMMRQAVAGIATGRKLPETAVRALVDNGPQLAEEALAAGMVDHLGYRDEALAAARQLAAGPGALVTVSRLLKLTTAPTGRAVALIQAVGTIVGGAGDSSPLTGSTLATAENLTRAFRQAADDKDVAAILFRIDSPGGSAVASETIWREVARARAAGKPVVVSMGNVAASGGYYIAAGADKIVAEPGTITGSIGVFGGKIVLSGLLDKVGARMSAVQVGANAGMWSAFEPYSPAGRERLDRFIDATYAAFKDRVASGRKLSPAAVEAAARGRVWSGEDARAAGLVDALGGYDTAQGLIREALALPAGASLTLKTVSGEEEEWWTRILTRVGLASVTLSRLSGVIEGVDPALERLDQALSARPGALTMPSFEVR